MYPEDDLLPLSAVADFVYCARRAALHRIEGVWEESTATAEGHLLHDRTHEAGSESRGDLRIARGLRLRSLQLGLTGMADVVEFHRLDSASRKPAPEATIAPRRASRPPETLGLEGGNPLPPDGGVPLPGARGLWLPFPVEYKRGILRHEAAYAVQLCAQAMCLEEMLSTPVPAGALFYGLSRRRLDVTFDEGLRQATRVAAQQLHELLLAGVTPAPDYGPKCKRCSLLDLCRPKETGGGRSVARYLANALRDGDGAKGFAPSREFDTRLEGGNPLPPDGGKTDQLEGGNPLPPDGRKSL